VPRISRERDIGKVFTRVPECGSIAGDNYFFAPWRTSVDDYESDLATPVPATVGKPADSL